MKIQDIKYMIMYDLKFLEFPYKIEIKEDDEDKGIFNFSIETKEYGYMINADEKENYLGCIMGCDRGGNDFSDGELSVETWNHIISDIQLNESW